MDLRIRRRLFDSPPCDEVALSSLARAQLVELSSPPTPSEIQQFSQRVSSDLAARIFYEGLLASDHGEFVRYIDELSGDTVVAKVEGVKLLVVPGMFYREHPEVGADGGLALEIAQRFGFNTKTIGL